MIDLKGSLHFWAMKTHENKMKDFQNIMKASEKNKVLRYCIVLFLGLFHVFI